MAGSTSFFLIISHIVLNLLVVACGPEIAEAGAAVKDLADAKAAVTVRRRQRIPVEAMLLDHAGAEAAVRLHARTPQPVQITSNAWEVQGIEALAVVNRLAQKITEATAVEQAEADHLRNLRWKSKKLHKHMLHAMKVAFTNEMLREMRVRGLTEEVFCEGGFSSLEMGSYSTRLGVELTSPVRARLLDPLHCRRWGGCVRENCRVGRRCGASPIDWTLTTLPRMALPEDVAYVTV